MPINEPRYLYHYWLQDWEDVSQTLATLAKVADGLRARGGAVENTPYQYAPALYQRVASHDPLDPLWPIDQQILRLLDLQLVDQFFANALNTEGREALADQLFLLSAALGLLPPTEPYTAEELVGIFDKQEEEFYSVGLFLYTLRRVLSGWQVEQMLPVAASFLLTPPIMAGSRRQFEWENLILYVMLLHALWRWFPYLQPNDQDTLLGNFFYQAVVAGVPARDYLRRFFALPGIETSAELGRLNSALLKSPEPVPTDTTAGGWQPLGVLLSQFFNQAGQDPTSGFRQDQFERDIYQNQDGRDAFGKWLREVINLAAHFKTGTVNF